MTLAATSVLSVSDMRAQDAAAPQVAVAAATPTTPVTLADLVAPIALYPDQLLGQVLTVSATPQEVLDLGNWLIENDTLTGSKAQDAAKAAGFSTSAQYLALFPQVVDNMAQEIDWTTQLGDAFTDKPKDVMAAIQQKRLAAQKAGNLKTSSQMTVETKKADDGTSYIAISPTDPKVIYVPVYNPVNVYVTNPTPAPAAAAPTTTTTTTTATSSSGVSTGAAVGIGLLSFGVGMAVGAAINNDYYPYPMWGYGGMYYGGRPYYPPPYRPPYYPGYRPAYGYHPPANYHWNQVNRQTNITINNNNYYNKINNNPRKPSGNANRPGQIAGGNRPGGGGGGEYKGGRPNTNDRPGAGNNRPGGGNDRPGAGNNRPGGNDRPGAGANRPGGNDRPGAGGGGVKTAARPEAGGGDRGYGGGGAGAANRAAPSKAAAPASRSGGAFGSAGGGSGSSARAASNRGRASAGAPARGGGGGGGGNRGGGGGGRKH